MTTEPSVSKGAYAIKDNNVQVGDIIKDENEKPYAIVVNTMNTNTDKLPGDKKPRKNDMQALTAIEIKNEFKTWKESDLIHTSGYPNSVISKNVIIGYAGTQSLRDWQSNVDEILINDRLKPFKFSASFIPSNPALKLAANLVRQKVDTTFTTADDYAKSVLNTYSPNNGYHVSTTGHSLGGSEAIHVAVKNGLNAFTFSAASPVLSQKEIHDYTGTIVNLYSTGDLVTSSFLTGGQTAIPFNSFGISGLPRDTFGHDLSNFKLDSNGNYIDGDGHIVVYIDGQGGIDLARTRFSYQMSLNRQQIADMLRISKSNVMPGQLPQNLNQAKIDALEAENKVLAEKLKSLNDVHTLRDLFTRSGGGLSQSEKIYLEDRYALTIVALASADFNETISHVKQAYTEGIETFIKNWRATNSAISYVSPHLSGSERIQVATEQGFTEQNALHSPIKKYEEKLKIIKQQQSDFEDLISQIRKTIKDRVDQDKELADQIKKSGLGL